MLRIPKHAIYLAACAFANQKEPLNLLAGCRYYLAAPAKNAASQFHLSNRVVIENRQDRVERFFRVPVPGLDMLH
jgi:hypothetical protein